MIEDRNKPRSYAESVRRTLREQILSGELRPGDRLVELDIAARLGVSQGPVREALARLTEEGIIIALPHRGSFVSEITVEEARDIYVTRLVVERQAIRLALPGMGESNFALMEQDIASMLEAAEADRFAENVARDMTFHRRVFEWSRSPTLLAFWSHIETRTRAFTSVASPQVFSDHVEVARSHYDLVAALRSRDDDAIDLELDRHLRAIWERLEDE
jgi:DNA-binding GntR family transcriptional regulator